MSNKKGWAIGLGIAVVIIIFRETYFAEHSVSYEGSCYKCGGSVHFEFDSGVSESSHAAEPLCWPLIISPIAESELESGSYPCLGCDAEVKVIEEGGDFFKFSCRHIGDCPVVSFRFDQELFNFFTSKLEATE